jgi:hypothetical protein
VAGRDAAAGVRERRAARRDRREVQVVAAVLVAGSRLVPRPALPEPEGMAQADRLVVSLGSPLPQDADRVL